MSNNAAITGIRDLALFGIMNDLSCDTPEDIQSLKDHASQMLYMTNGIRCEGIAEDLRRSLDDHRADPTAVNELAFVLCSIVAANHPRLMIDRKTELTPLGELTEQILYGLLDYSNDAQ